MASKIIYVLISMVILNLALITFSCSSWNSETGECAGTLVSSGAEDNSTIWSLAFNPTEVGDGFWNKLFGSGWGLLAIIGTVSIATVLVGSTIFGRDLTPIVYVAMAIGMASTVYPAIKLWQVVNGLSMIGDSLTRNILAIVLVSTIIITVIFTIIDWGRGRE